jgi:hypothetical protein
MRIERLAVTLTAVSLATLAGAQIQPRPAPTDTSWGKAGVTLEDYRTDAILCARHAANLDISGTEAAQTLVDATRAIDNAASAGWLTAPSATDRATSMSPNLDLGRTMAAYRVERQFGDISDLQYETLATCLGQLGYRRFRLTGEQRRRLRRLEHGSDERRAYLHSLASNPEVLSRQGL